MSSNGFYSNYITTNGLNEINATDINTDNISSSTINTVSLFVNGVQITGSSSGSATVNVGTTTTLPAGNSATVINNGSSTNAVLNFGIPQGQEFKEFKDNKDNKEFKDLKELVLYIEMYLIIQLNIILMMLLVIMVLVIFV